MLKAADHLLEAYISEISRSFLHLLLYIANQCILLLPGVHLEHMHAQLGTSFLFIIVQVAILTRLDWIAFAQLSDVIILDFGHTWLEWSSLALTFRSDRFQGGLGSLLGEDSRRLLDVHLASLIDHAGQFCAGH